MRHDSTSSLDGERRSLNSFGDPHPRLGGYRGHGCIFQRRGECETWCRGATRAQFASLLEAIHLPSGLGSVGRNKDTRPEPVARVYKHSGVRSWLAGFSASTRFGLVHSAGRPQPRGPLDVESKTSRSKISPVGSSSARIRIIPWIYYVVFNLYCSCCPLRPIDTRRLLN